MAEGLSFLTSELFLSKALIGACIGYGLRVFEHVVWSLKAPPEKNPLGNLVWAIMILPQSFLFGLALGYVLLVAMTLMSSQAVLGANAYLITAFTAFLADDIRELIRRERLGRG